MSKISLSTAAPMLFVATANPEAAQQFYSETIGLELLADEEFALVYAIGDGLTLRVQKLQAVTPAMGTVLGWVVDDINDACQKLTAKGVQFDFYGLPGQAENGICTFPNGDMVAWFKDPDGNTLSLAEAGS